MTASLPAFPPAGGAPVTKKPGGGLLPAARPAAITIGVFTVLLVLAQIGNSFSGNWLTTHLGIEPRTVRGLDGILAAPLLHGNWGHLLSNLVPFVILGFLLMVGGVRQFVAVTVLVWLISGVGVWLFGPGGGVTVGASALIFGWLAYLVLRGVFTRNWGQIGIGILLLAVWGGIFWTGIIKVALGVNHTNISWQGHLFGALGGALAAFLVARADGPRRPKAAPTALTPAPFSS